MVLATIEGDYPPGVRPRRLKIGYNVVIDNDGYKRVYVYAKEADEWTPISTSNRLVRNDRDLTELDFLEVAIDIINDLYRDQSWNLEWIERRRRRPWIPRGVKEWRPQ